MLSRSVGAGYWLGIRNALTVEIRPGHSGCGRWRGQQERLSGGGGSGRSAGKDEEELEPGCKVGSGSRKGWLLGSSMAWMFGVSLVMYW